MALLSVGQTWDGSKIASWGNQSAPTDALGPRVAQASDGTMSLSCFNADVAPLTPNQNPRAQLASPDLIDLTGEYRVKARLRVPTASLPASIDGNGGKWVEFLQFAYGQPFAGSPPLRIMTQDAKTFGLRLADQQPYAWSATLARDVWWNFDCGFAMSTDPGKGWFWLAAYQDGQPYKVVVPGTAYQTVQASNNAGPNSVRLDAYVQLGTADRIGAIQFAGVSVSRTA